eukprot:TRINITY_DN1824_c0_g2_i1.p1 TRINITY_DN1824_c0_g2~~TRINITY_DN1824_c0_g2_i1.p1  ORF type:complete len:691 (-),score=211.32 TRINITY_DN1824_c0_g2_i1:122-2194(-)
MDAASRRRKEMEEKRRKLAAIREKKAKRKEAVLELTSDPVMHTSTTTSVSQPSSVPTSREHAIVSSVLEESERRADEILHATPDAPDAPDASDSSFGKTSLGGEPTHPTHSAEPQTSGTGVLKDDTGETVHQELRRRRGVHLEEQDVMIVDIPPSSVLKYEKDVQTDIEFSGMTDLLRDGRDHRKTGKNTRESANLSSDDEGRDDDDDHDDSDDEEDEENEGSKGRRAHEADHGEQMTVTVPSNPSSGHTSPLRGTVDAMSSSVFESEFMTPRTTEEHSSQPQFGSPDLDTEEHEYSSSGRPPLGLEALSKLSVDTETRGCPVASIAWCPHDPVKWASSYYKSLSSSGYDDMTQGVVIVWSLRMRYPVKVLKVKSFVSALLFLDPWTLIGGCGTGEIVIWDTKTWKMRTSTMTTESHVQSIVGVHAISDEPTQFVSISVDGRMCVWKKDDLKRPTLAVNLNYTSEKSFSGLSQSQHSMRTTSPSCSFAGSPLMPGRIMVGNEDGVVLVVQDWGKTSTAQKIAIAHSFPVTGVAVQHKTFDTAGVETEESTSAPTSASSVLIGSAAAPLMITSSVDWTCKVWNAEKLTPLLTLDSFRDYVYDVAWSPAFCSLFATVDGAGKLKLWNLTENIESSVWEESLPTGINRVAFNRDGRYIACGDADGTVHLFKVAAKYTKQKDAVVGRRLQAMFH